MSERPAPSFGAAVFFYVEEDGLVRLSGVWVGRRARRTWTGVSWLPRVRRRWWLRADGDVLTGEAFVVPRDGRDMLGRLKQATDLALSLDWRFHDVNVVPVISIE